MSESTSPDSSAFARADGDPSVFARDLGVASRAIAGDEGARREFIERMMCVPRMLAARNSKLSAPLPDNELEEVSQEALVAIWRRLGDFRGDASLETFACAFCHRTLLHALKTRWRRRQDSGIDPTARREESVEEAHDCDRFDRLYRALDELGTDEARILRFKHFDQLTFDQIALRTRRASSTIKSCYYQAIDRLRSRLRLRDADGGAP